MTTPPPLPISKPPPLPPQERHVPTAVYAALFLLLFAINAAWVYRQAVSRFPNRPAVAAGYMKGGLILPLVAAAGIASIWKQNRGFRGIVRVLFWTSLLTLFSKFSQLANSQRLPPVKPAAGGAVIASRLETGIRAPGVWEPDHST